MSSIEVASKYVGQREDIDHVRHQNSHCERTAKDNYEHFRAKDHNSAGAENSQLALHHKVS